MERANSYSWVEGRLKSLSTEVRNTRWSEYWNQLAYTISVWILVGAEGVRDFLFHFFSSSVWSSVIPQRKKEHTCTHARTQAKRERDRDRDRDREIETQTDRDRETDRKPSSAQLFLPCHANSMYPTAAAPKFPFVVTRTERQCSVSVSMAKEAASQSGQDQKVFIRQVFLINQGSLREPGQLVKSHPCSHG